MFCYGVGFVQPLLARATHPLHGALACTEKGRFGGVKGAVSRHFSFLFFFFFSSLFIFVFVNRQMPAELLIFFFFFLNYRLVYGWSLDGFC